MRRKSLAVIVGLGLSGLLLIVLILQNESSLVTRGPNSLTPQLEAAWKIVSDPASTPEDLARAEQAVAPAMKAEPLNSAPLALLGAIRDRQGDKAQADSLMRMAGRINGRDNIAQLWLFEHLLAQKDYDGAFLNADALLRREADFTTQLFPALASTLNDPAAIDPLARRLAASPSWRPVFMAAVLENYQDPTGAFTLLSAMKSAGGSISASELTTYLSRMVAARRFEEAYLNWILFLPDSLSSNLSYVYDGDFDSLPDARPFGWDIGGNVSGSMDVPRGVSNNDPALRITYDGVSARNLPSQLLVLPPGRYNLVGQMLSSSAEGADRLEWTIVCENTTRTVIARSPARNTDGQWKAFSTSFATPADCPAQRLALTATPADRRADIEVWYDSMNVEPAEAAS